MVTRREMFEGIKADYPTMPDEFITTFLDMYEKDREWIENRIKTCKKEHKGKIPEPKSQLTLEEMERLGEKFKDTPQGRAWVETANVDEPQLEVIADEISD